MNQSSIRLPDQFDFTEVIKSIKFNYEDQTVCALIELDQNNPQLHELIEKIQKNSQKMELQHFRSLKKNEDFKLSKTQYDEFIGIIQNKMKNDIALSQKFYSYYSDKLYKLKFATIENFNERFTELYPQNGIAEELAPRKLLQSYIYRYGQTWNINNINSNSLKKQTEKNKQNLGGLIESLSFYIKFTRERLYCIKQALVFRFIDLHKKSPYSYYYLFDFSDTVDISLNYLFFNSQTQRSQDQQPEKQLESQIFIPLDLKVRYLRENLNSNTKHDASNNFILNYCRNLILPFQVLQYSDNQKEIINIHIILIEVNKDKLGVFNLTVHSFSDIPDYIQQRIFLITKQWLQLKDSQVQKKLQKHLNNQDNALQGGLYLNFKQITDYLEQRILKPKEKLAWDEVIKTLQYGIRPEAPLPYDMLFKNKTDFKNLHIEFLFNEKQN